MRVSLITIVAAGRAFATYMQAGEGDDVGALSGSRPDERQRLLSLRSRALAFNVTAAAAFTGLTVAVAIGASWWWPFAVILGVAGLGYVFGLSAELGNGVPDGICADAENAVWYADVPNKRCVRVREGGEVLDTVELDRGCFACALGGPDRSTLFMIATEWSGPASMFHGPRTGQVVTTGAPAPGAGWP